MKMIQSWQFWLVLSFIGGMVLLFAFGFTTDPKKVPSPLIDKKAPDFQVRHLQTGEEISLASLRGKPVILNFWASWCVECRAEARVLEAYHQKYGKGDLAPLQIVGIAIQDTVENAQAFAQAFGKSYFLGIDDPSGSIALDYGIYGVPETFFLDPEGVIRFKQIGGVTEAVMSDQLKKWLP